MVNQNVFYKFFELETEAQKDHMEYYTEMTDGIIASIVTYNPQIRKAYNYYNGKRDPEQFRALEENYGLLNPVAVEFIPLVRKHIDRLVGDHLLSDLIFHVSCKDSKTLTTIKDEKRQNKLNIEANAINEVFQKNLNKILKGQTLTDADMMSNERFLSYVADESNKFISKFEIAAQRIINHTIQSKAVDFKNKLRTIFTDLLVCGIGVYRVEASEDKEFPNIIALNPQFTYFNKNMQDPYINKSDMACYVDLMTRTEILNKYGTVMTKDDRDILFNMEQTTLIENNNVKYTMVSSSSAEGGDTYPINIQMMFDRRWDEFTKNDLVPVYHVEWLANNKIKEGKKNKYRMDRYKCTRIGNEIYVDYGIDKNAPRSIESPLDTCLSINGLRYSDRNGSQYSLVLATATLQDKYDIAHFWRDNLVANSGVKGSIIDVSKVPDFLSPDGSMAEKLARLFSYKKQGAFLIDSSQDNTDSNLNTIYNGYDDTVSGQAVQAIQFIINSIEDTCSSITGVFRETLNGIEQRDAVSNVQMGVKQSNIITRQYHFTMDLISKHMINDTINACKVAFKKRGFISSLVVGDIQEIFEVIPKDFCYTDFDINLLDTAEAKQNIETIQALTMELIKAGQVDIQTVMSMLGNKSITEMKQKVITDLEKKKKENDQLQQMQQQLQQLQQQAQEMQKQAQALQQENEKLKAKDRELEERKINGELANEKEKIAVMRAAQEMQKEKDKAIVDLERLQLYDSIPQNDEIAHTKK